MTFRATAVAGLLLFLAAEARTEEGREAREDASRRELLRIQGTWRLESLEDGKKKAGPGLKKRTFFVGGGVFLVQEGDKIVQAGTLRLAPSKAPKGVDAVVRKGPHEGTTMLGIYELKGDRLRVCFDTEGDHRPKEFAAKPGSALFVAVYQRARPAGEDVDIVGRYKCESFGAEGVKQTTTAEIQRHGDAYLVRWSVGKDTAYVGIAIRRGDTLSVAWANRGSVGVSVYEIEKGPKLVGVYTEVTGVGIIAKEQLTAGEAPPREARGADGPARAARLVPGG
jgi:uncharacterized protein (TIGR03067 family)